MSGSYLDTTIVVNISDPISPEKKTNVDCVNKYQPSSVPYYALRELLNGPLRYLCAAHNALLAADNPGMAYASISRMYHQKPRAKASSTQAIMDSLQQIWENDPSLPAGQMKEECIDNLLIRINRIWRNAQSIKNTDLVDSLACFNHGEITRGSANEANGPNGSHNCLESKRCSAAEYLFDKQLELDKLIQELHPTQLGETLSKKQENVSRRSALKELKNKGPKDFNKSKCPALGDAYFAIMCPPDKAVMTTNIVDHQLLCQALGKSVIKP